MAASAYSELHPDLWGGQRQYRTEQEDRPVRAQLADCDRFRDVGHAEQVGSGVHEPRRGLRQAVSIGVGLHDGDILDTRR